MFKNTRDGFVNRLMHAWIRTKHSKGTWNIYFTCAQYVSDVSERLCFLVIGFCKTNGTMDWLQEWLQDPVPMVHGDCLVWIYNLTSYIAWHSQTNYQFKTEISLLSLRLHLITGAVPIDVDKTASADSCIGIQIIRGRKAVWLVLF